MTHISNFARRAHPAAEATPRHRSAPALLVALGLLGSWAAAAEVPADIHEPLNVDPSLDWATLIDQTVAHFPSFVELAGRDAEAAALAARAHSWLAGQPAMSFRYQSDGAFDRTGLREYEAGLDLPLWWPGQRRRAEALGAAAYAESDAAAMSLRHDVIGLLRSVLWDIERAARADALAHDGVEVGADLLRVVERRYDAGELPMTDVLLARNALMQREAILIDAQAALLDAERSYRSLTGLDARPAGFAEPLSVLDALVPSHPAIQLVEAELERARSEMALIEAMGRGTPVLTVGPRREQAPLSTLRTDSLGVTVTIPFGGRRHRDVQTTAAGRRVAAAVAARARTYRALELSLHEARHGLAVVEASLDLARQRDALATRHLQLSETAFAQGEMSLFELLQQEETARAARHEVARLEVERQRAIAQVNQALGEWP